MINKLLQEQGLKLIQLLSEEQGHYRLRVLDKGGIFRVIEAFVVVDPDTGVEDYELVEV